MGGKDSLNIVGLWTTVTTAAGWMLAVVSARKVLALPEGLIVAGSRYHRCSSHMVYHLQCLLSSTSQLPGT